MSNDNPFAVGGAQYHQQRELNEGAKALAWIEQANNITKKSFSDLKQQEKEHQAEIAEIKKENQKSDEAVVAVSAASVLALNVAKVVVNKLKVEKEDLIQKNNNLVKENEYYKNLLCKPMSEIAASNGNFRETYEAQQELMADWMVSQKAFKELAIQFGAILGKSKDEVVKTGMNMKIDVLEDKHNPINNTNVGDSDIIGPYVNVLKSKFVLKN